MWCLQQEEESNSAQHPVSLENSDKAAARSHSLLRLEPESELSLAVGCDGCSPLLSVSLEELSLLLGSAAG